jgi:flagellar protein FlaG
MSTDFSSLTGGPRAPVTPAPASPGKNVVALRPAGSPAIQQSPVRQGIAAPASKPVSTPVQADVAEQVAENRLNQQREEEVEALRNKVEELNQNAQSIRRSLRFDVDDNTGITVITVRDRDTDEVIRQIPSEELLELARYFAEASENKGENKGLLLRAEV